MRSRQIIFLGIGLFLIVVGVLRLADGGMEGFLLIITGGLAGREGLKG